MARKWEVGKDGRKLSSVRFQLDHWAFAKVKEGWESALCLENSASDLQCHCKYFCHYRGGGVSPRKSLLSVLVADGLKLTSC